MSQKSIPLSVLLTFEQGFAEALLFSHYRINILEEINDLTVLYNHAQQWAKYTKIEKETCVKAFIQQRILSWTSEANGRCVPVHRSPGLSDYDMWQGN